MRWCQFQNRSGRRGQTAFVSASRGSPIHRFVVWEASLAVAAMRLATLSRQRPCAVLPKSPKVAGEVVKLINTARDIIALGRHRPVSNLLIGYPDDQTD